MVADHPLTGVGPGNFACIYHQYKPPSAPETVSDPHCFVLSILTQYGPLGLLGFLAIILVPLWRTSGCLTEPAPTPSKTRPAPNSEISQSVCIIAPVAAMLLLRPFILPPSTAIAFYEKLYVFSTAYVTPAAAFIVGCRAADKITPVRTAPRPALRRDNHLQVDMHCKTPPSPPQHCLPACSACSSITS